MRLHRFYISPEDFAPKSGLSKETHQEIHIGEAGKSEEGSDHERLIHQWRDIFRFGAGDRVLLFNKEAGEWLAEFISLDKKRGAALKVIEQNLAGIDSGAGSSVATKVIPQKNITLYMAIIKNSNFDLVVEKATELGVSKIVPIQTSRTVKSGLNFERLRKLAIEASEQSGRIDIPEISEIMDFDNALSDAKQLIENKSGFFGHISDEKSDFLSSELKKDVAIFIGPEGGWTDEEIVKFEQEGVLPLSLGQFVLRAETAAIVGVSMLAR